MSESLIVILPSTLRPEHPDSGTMALYISQLDAAGIEHEIVPLAPNRPNANGGGTLGYKVELFRGIIALFGEYYDKIVISDSFDVQFFGSREDVLRKIPDDCILCAAEKNCYPEPHLASEIPATSSGFSFFNGGLAAGTPANFLAWLHWIETHSEYDPNVIDQLFFNRRLAGLALPLFIDSDTTLFYSMFLAWDDIDFENALPVNKRTGEHPQFLHFNNHSDRAEVWERRELSLRGTNNG